MYIFNLSLSDPDGLLEINNKHLKKIIGDGYEYTVGVYANDLDEAYEKVHSHVEDDFKSELDFDKFKNCFVVKYKEPIMTASQLVIYVQKLINKYGNKPISIGGSYVTSLSDFVRLDKDSDSINIEGVF